MKQKKQERKKEKKEIKLIREKVNTQFKESPRFEEESPEEQENIEETEASDFSFSGARTAPTLTPSNQQQTIEEQVANAPAERKKRESDGNYSSSAVYNMPDYAGSKLYENENKMQTERAGVKQLSFDSETANLKQTNLRRATEGYPEAEQPEPSTRYPKYSEDMRSSDKVRRTTFRRDREKVF